MPLPSFNMEDILSIRVPNFQIYPSITSGYREIRNGFPTKQGRFLNSNIHSQMTMSIFPSGQQRQGISNKIGDDTQLVTCQYSVIKRTADVGHENPPRCGTYDGLSRSETEGKRLDHNAMDISQLDLHNTTITRPAEMLGRRRSSDLRRKRRRIRTVFSDKQLTALEDRFACQKYLSTPDRETVAAGLGLTQMQVKTWYQNRRMRWKKSILSGECLDDLTESLKKGKGRPKERSEKHSCRTCKPSSAVQISAKTKEGSKYLPISEA